MTRSASGRNPPDRQRPQDTGPVAVMFEAVYLFAEGRSPRCWTVSTCGFLQGSECASSARAAPASRACSGWRRALSLPQRAAAGLEGPCLPGRHRPALAWVPQHPTVLPATVLDNVALGRPGADERALTALEAAGLGTWLTSLPRGLHTPLSEFSAPLSLGERRRLAVARSLAGPCPRLWLLDEPTAGLDPDSARRLVTELGRITEGVTAVIATHDPAAMVLGQRTIELRHGRIRRGKPHRHGEPHGPGRPSAGERRMTRPRVPGLDRRACRHLLAAIGIALAGELAAVGLLATGAWLLLSAALRPPILLLSVAIGTVQVLSLLRGTARYAERLGSHSAGLRLQAGLRTWLYRCLERLVPAGLPGGDRGDLLTRLISDTEEAQDLIVRAAVPVPAAAVAWCAAVTATAILLPAAGLALLAAGVAGAAGITVAVVLADRNSAALPAARGAVGSWILGVLGSSEELAAVGAADWVLAQLAERERALGTRTRAVAAATGLGRVSIAFAGGAGLAGVAWTGAGAQRFGRISPVEFGVLVFMALGVAGLLQGLPDAVSRLPVGRASLQRLSGLSRLPGPVAAQAEDGGRYGPP